MSKDIKELQKLIIEQLKRRNFFPINEQDSLLRLGEEVGEVFEAIREKQNLRKLSHEIVDVLWMILVLCELKKIDIEKAFLEKYKKNEKRPSRD